MRQKEIDENIRTFIKQLDEVINGNHPTDIVPHFQIKAQLLLSLKETVGYRDYNDKCENGDCEYCKGEANGTFK